MYCSSCQWNYLCQSPNHLSFKFFNPCILFHSLLIPKYYFMRLLQGWNLVTAKWLLTINFLSQWCKIWQDKEQHLWMFCQPALLATCSCQLPFGLNIPILLISFTSNMLSLLLTIRQDAPVSPINAFLVKTEKVSPSIMCTWSQLKTTQSNMSITCPSSFSSSTAAWAFYCQLFYYNILESWDQLCHSKNIFWWICTKYYSHCFWWILYPCFYIKISSHWDSQPPCLHIFHMTCMYLWNAYYSKLPWYSLLPSSALQTMLFLLSCVTFICTLYSTSSIISMESFQVLLTTSLFFKSARWHPILLEDFPQHEACSSCWMLIPPNHFHPCDYCHHLVPWSWLHNLLLHF